jgi:hypothetical protein
VYPILEAKCFSCHSSRKQKGDLRLDGIENILKGGEHGSIVEVGLPDSSTLYARLILPLEDEDHMPPNEKSQLSSAAIDAIHLWVKYGFDFEKRVDSYDDNEYLKKVIATIKMDEVPQFSWVPTEEVNAAGKEALDKLASRDILVIPVSNESNYLKANFVNVKSFQSTDLDLLISIKDQLVWLDLTNCSLTDEDVKRLNKLDNLRYLYLRNNKVTDSGVLALTDMPNLQYVNLSNTEVTGEGLKKLVELKNLRELYVYNSKASSAELKSLITTHPTIHLDTGGYQLPELPTDTIIYE